MSLQIDFTNVPDSNTVPAGTYAAKVFNIELKESRAGDSMNLNWQFKIQGGKQDGRSVFTITSLKPAALWKLKQMLKAIAPDLDTTSIAELDTDMLIGRDCRIVVAIRQWEGEDRNDLKTVLPAEDGGFGGVTADLPI